MLQIQEESAAEVRVLSLFGKIDFYGTQAFKAALGKTEKEAINHIVLDLSHVPFNDSASLGVLVTTQKRFAQTNKTIYLVIDPESPVGQVLNRPSIQKLMPIFHSKREALSSFLVNQP